MRGTDHHPIVFVAARRSTSARTDMLAPNGLRVPVGAEVQEGDDEPETSLAGFRDEETNLLHAFARQPRGVSYLGRLKTPRGTSAVK